MMNLTTISNLNIRPGIKAMLMSTAAFAIMNISIKYCTNISAWQIIFFRSLIGMLTSLVFIRLSELKALSNFRLEMLLRGIFGFGGLFTFTLTIQTLDLPTAVTLQYLSPIFTALIAQWLLKEKLGIASFLCFGISFIGVYILQGISHDSNRWAVLIGILSGLFSGLAYNMVRLMNRIENPFVIVFYFQAISLVLSAVALPSHWTMPNNSQIILLLIIGLSAVFGQLKLTEALQAEPAASVSILNYLGILYAFFLNFFIMKTSIDNWAIMGIILILAGVIFQIYITSNKSAKIFSK